MELRVIRVGRCLFASGALTDASVASFHRQIAYAAELVEVLDLGDLTITDTAAMTALLTVRRRYPRLAIVNPSVTAQPVLEVTGPTPVEVTLDVRTEPMATAN